MATAKEIKSRIESISETRKITNAMYLIASTKMRKAKADLDLARPYFKAVKFEIKHMFRSLEHFDSPYLYPDEDEPNVEGTNAYLVITADKGLAGAYNQNLIKATENLLSLHPDSKLFVVGEYGRQHFTRAGYRIEKSFLYTAQNPTLQRAREIAYMLLELFERGKIAKIYVIYTDLTKSMVENVNCVRLLPLHQSQFKSPDDEENTHAEYEFAPSVKSVLRNVIPSYIAGFIFCALIDSFCSEQSCRMEAMEAANRNADEIIARMKVQYNHIRQASITQEIAEISAGAKYQNRLREEAEK